ncbi:MAG: DUF1697 domain-containing protein [Clostridiaceae bacterium]
MMYAAFFRGINVGGKNVVRMAELKQLLMDKGLRKVKTYIQSGNAVFETALDETLLVEKIKGGFISRFGFESHVVVRSTEELRVLIEQLPFTSEEIAEAEAADPQAEHLYVYFLDTPPEKKQLDGISRDYTGKDMVSAGKKEIYLLCLQSIRISKLAARVSKTFPSCTIRNWRTVNKLYDMIVENPKE